jgi:uncharacterized protein YyaL (SSP411 family)
VISAEEAHSLLESAKRKLYAARLRRPTPFVDKTIYVAWNAMCISAYLAAGRVLDAPAAKAFALKSLDRVLAEARNARGDLAHVAAYGEPEEAGSSASLHPSEQRPLAGDPGLRNDKQKVAGVLDDYVFLGHAALDAWEATGELHYYEAAEDLTESALRRFYDPAGGAFFDTENPAAGERRLGVLGARRKPLQDSPTPAGNPMAAALLMRVGELNGRLDYAEKAQETLETFAGVVEHFGLYAATYALALQRLVREPVQVCVVGEDAGARALEAAALARYAVNQSVVRFGRVQAGSLPPVLETTLPRLPRVPGSFAVLCSGHTCQPPVKTPEELTAVLGRSL